MDIDQFFAGPVGSFFALTMMAGAITLLVFLPFKFLGWLYWKFEVWFARQRVRKTAKQMIGQSVSLAEVTATSAGYDVSVIRENGREIAIESDLRWCFLLTVENRHVVNIRMAAAPARGGGWIVDMNA